MKKRILWLILAATLVLSAAAACSNQDNSGADTSAGTTATSTASAPASASTGSESQSPAQPEASAAVSAPKEDPVNLVFLFLADWGGKPNRMDEVLAEFHRQAGDELNVTIDFLWLNDYFTALQMKLAAGEQIDSCFDAPWAS